jgi:FMN phosphatase YigB (HAD superfamily)
MHNNNLYNKTFSPQKMHPIFDKVNAIGFDLDNTLYENNPEIDSRISLKIAQKVLEQCPRFKTVEETNKYLTEQYLKLGSRSLVIKGLGINDSGELVTDCIAEANILDLLQRDERLVSLLERTKQKYSTFIITAGVKEISMQKLERLGISPNLFDQKIYGDTSLAHRKTNGTIFQYLLDRSPFPASQHVYIGDNLKADILPPKSLGMKAIAVGSEIPEADFSIKKIHDLEQLIF